MIYYYLVLCFFISVYCARIQIQYNTINCTHKNLAIVLDNSEVRQQSNELSSYLDMGIIYGNSDEHLTAIRETDGKYIMHLSGVYLF